MSIYGVPLILPRVKHGAGLLQRTFDVRFWPTHQLGRRGKMSLLIRRDATLRTSGALHLGIFDQPVRNEFSTGS